jgi:hypothetical protein
MCNEEDGDQDESEEECMFSESKSSKKEETWPTGDQDIPRQTRIPKNAFKRPKKVQKSTFSGRVWMTIAVPDCQRKTPIFCPFWAFKRVFSEKTRVNAQKEQKKWSFFSRL